MFLVKTQDSRSWDTEDARRLLETHPPPGFSPTPVERDELGSRLLLKVSVCISAETVTVAQTRS